MFVSTNRVLVIEVVKDELGACKRLRLKNGDVFYTAFPSKKLGPLPETIGEGSQVSISGFIKVKETEKYGTQYSITATQIVELTTQTASSRAELEPGSEPLEVPGEVETSKKK